MSLPPDLAAGVNEARSWLRHQKSLAEEKSHFQEVCGELEAALYQDAPLEDIESLHARATAYGLPMPEKLATQLAAVLRDKRLVADRAKRRNLILLGVIVLGVAVGSILMVQHMRTQSAVTEAVNRLNYAREQYDFAAGRKAWEEMQANSPGIASSGDVATAHQKLEQAAEAEAKRLADFEAAKTAAAAPNISSAERGMQLDNAERLARLDSEKLKVKVLRRQLLPPPAAPAAPCRTVGGAGRTAGTRVTDAKSRALFRWF